jgi:RNA-directed DNA polymerase
MCKHDAVASETISLRDDQPHRQRASWSRPGPLPHLAQTPGVFAGIDEWMRHRRRAIQLKHWKRGTTMDRELLAMGAKPDHARRVAANGPRWRRNSGTALNAVLTTRWLAELGAPLLF